MCSDVSLQEAHQLLSDDIQFGLFNDEERSHERVGEMDRYNPGSQGMDASDM